jgi:hypothetical protein
MSPDPRSPVPPHDVRPFDLDAHFRERATLIDLTPAHPASPSWWHVLAAYAVLAVVLVLGCWWLR